MSVIQNQFFISQIESIFECIARDIALIILT